jgi:hypothetical protein
VENFCEEFFANIHSEPATIALSSSALVTAAETVQNAMRERSLVRRISRLERKFVAPSRRSLCHSWGLFFVKR